REYLIADVRALTEQAGTKRVASGIHASFERPSLPEFPGLDEIEVRAAPSGAHSPHSPHSPSSAGKVGNVGNVPTEVAGDSDERTAWLACVRQRRNLPRTGWKAHGSRQRADC